MAGRQAEEMAFGLAGGCVTVVAAALATAALCTPSEQGARLLAMAATAGVLAAVLADWRACLGVTVVAALIFVGFLAGHAGDLTSDRAAWPYTLVIVLAALLGRGLRRVRLAQVRRAAQ